MAPLRAVTLAAATAVCARAAWQLTLSDDFDGAALNTSLWTPRDNETHCSPCEPQLYLTSRLAVANGSLVITTDRDHVVGPGGELFNYSSG